MKTSTKKIFIYLRDSLPENRCFALSYEKKLDEDLRIFIYKDRRFFPCNANQILKPCMLLIFLCYKREDVMRCLYRIKINRLEKRG